MDRKVEEDLNVRNEKEAGQTPSGMKKDCTGSQGPQRTVMLENNNNSKNKNKTRTRERARARTRTKITRTKTKTITRIEAEDEEGLANCRKRRKLSSSKKK
jgi:hypothetical protein